MADGKETDCMFHCPTYFQGKSHSVVNLTVHLQFFSSSPFKPGWLKSKSGNLKAHQKNTYLTPKSLLVPDRLVPSHPTPASCIPLLL